MFSLRALAHDFPDRIICLELWLRPAAKPNNRVPLIFSLWDGTLPEIFQVGQWKDSLILRSRSLNPKPVRGYRERGSGQALIKDQKVFLTLNSSPEGTRLYQNGSQVKDFPGYRLMADRPAGNGALILGNSAIGKSFWEGRIYGLAIYNRLLSNQEVHQNHIRWIQGDYEKLKTLPGLVGLYIFNQGNGEIIPNLAANTSPLIKPAFFHPLQKVVLEGSGKNSMKRLSFFQDMAVNVIGFIPLGFFFALWLIRFTRFSSLGASALTFLSGTLISLGIELGQVYLPTRDSSVNDLIFNSLGTLIGIIMLQIDLKRKIFSFNL